MRHPKLPPAAWAALPTVVLLDRPGELLALRPRGPVDASFPYELAAWRTRDPRLVAVTHGDRVVVEPGLLVFEAEGYEVARFAEDAFLWWSEAVFDGDWWQARVEARCRAITAGAEWWTFGYRDRAGVHDPER
jgi:hypothetical protein